jgi:hypothetical protein
MRRGDQGIDAALVLGVARLQSLQHRDDSVQVPDIVEGTGGCGGRGSHGHRCRSVDGSGLLACSRRANWRRAGA